jgi:hypothetical protein
MAPKVIDMKGLKRKYPTAIYIKNWDELREYGKTHESHTHKLKIDEYTGMIVSKLTDGSYISEAPKRIKKRDRYKYATHYLSTHTFYGKRQYIMSTTMLQKSGFNVIIDNWDAEEETNE